MDRRTALHVLSAHAEAVRARGAKSLYLFGSTLRGDARADSDVDLFIDVAEPERFSLFELMDLRDYVSGLLGAKADILTRDSLHRAIRERIVAEADPVF